jgi:hypothetical protein
MKKSYLSLISITILVLVFIANIASAQVTGPSDITTLPPTTTTGAGKIICAGTAISITGPQDAGGVDYAAYRWYKIDASGTAQVVTGQTGRTYTEASGAPGYYNYQLVTINTNGCESPISDVFGIFVLPPLTVNITAANPSMCAVAANTDLLTANVTPASGYVINYQWTRNGTAVGTNSSTYAVTGETTAATVTFGVTVSYLINPTCTQSATKDIIIQPLPSKPMITAN